MLYMYMPTCGMRTFMCCLVQLTEQYVYKKALCACHEKANSLDWKLINLYNR